MSKKRSTLVFWCMLFLCITGYTSSLSAQATSTVHLTISFKDYHLRGITNTTCELVELFSLDTIRLKTDAQGVIKTDLTHGRLWQVNFKEIKDYHYWRLEMPNMTTGTISNMQRSYTYDVARYQRDMNLEDNRVKTKFTHEFQKYTDKETPTSTLALVKIRVLKADRTPHINYPVSLSCFKTGKSYDAITDKTGVAIFKIPFGQQYEVDLKDMLSVDFFDISPRPVLIDKTVTYQPPLLTEKISNDTVRQSFIAGKPEATCCMYVNVYLKDHTGKPGIGENVFLNSNNTNKVYTSITDQQGTVTFLVPKNDLYTLHMTWQRNLDAINLYNIMGTGFFNRGVTYRLEPAPAVAKNEEVEKIPKFTTADLYQGEYHDLKHPRVDTSAVTLYADWNSSVLNSDQGYIMQLHFLSGNYLKNTTSTSSMPANNNLNVCFVIDISGSMGGYESLTNYAIQQFVKKLRPTDVVSVVTFNDEYFIVQKPISVSEFDTTLVNRITRGGGTTIASGVKGGFIALNSVTKSNYINKVILLTDGYTTPLPDTMDTFLKAQYNKGRYLTVIGVGSYDQQTIQQLNKIGSTSKYSLYDKSITSIIIQQEKIAPPRAVAENVEVKITYDASQFASVTLLGYKVSSHDTDKGIIIFKPDALFEQQDLFAALRFVPLAGKKINPAQCKATIYISYIDLRISKLVKKTITVQPNVAVYGFAGNTEKETYAMNLIFTSLYEMSQLYYAGKSQEAMQVLIRCEKEVQLLFPEGYPKNIKDNLANLRYNLYILQNLKP